MFFLGTLFHDHKTQGQDLITKANLIVANTSNNGVINLGSHRLVRELRSDHEP